MSFARTVSLAALLTAPVFAQDAQKHMLRYTFKADHVWHAVISQEMNMSMNMGGQNMDTKMLMNMFTTNKIADVKEGKASIEQKITRIKAKMDMAVMNVDYDSADPDSDPGMLGALADMVGTATKMTISNSGKISDVVMPEEVSDQMAQSGMDLKQIMSQASVELPDTPIGIGETWTVKATMPLGQMGETATEVVNKLMAVTKDHYVLEQLVKVDTSEMEMPGGMELEDITMKGTNKISRATGVSHELMMKTKMKMSGQMDMTMDMKMTMKPAPAPAPKKADADTSKEEAAKKTPVGAGK